ncbi:amino acid adenylation domain-containing protein [Gammaproteobacteria bacterium]|nr:amino acid adenylation domain-containing protein [Gammaproteobacteria bacterium]
MIEFNLQQAWANNLKKNTERIAIEDNFNRWTYRKLDRISDSIACNLQKRGLKSGDVVAIFHTKKFISYATVLSCIKLGLIYSNFDINTPTSRLRRILNTCEPKILISDETLSGNLEAALDESKLPVWEIQEETLAIEHQEPLKTNFEANWNTPAYIMFTSGSTGNPKGVTITHGSIISFISWTSVYFNISEKDRFAQLSPMYFDNSVFDFYSALFCGACLVPVEARILEEPKKLIEFIKDMRCTIWFSVPSLLIFLLTMRVLRSEDLQHLRVIAFGGEGFPKTQLKKLFDLFSNRIRLVNVYGPTEATCICSAYDITESDFKDMKTLAPLGKINPNFDYLIVDEMGEPVEKGQKGELLLGGPNLSVGYFNDAKQTKEKFIQHPLIDAYYKNLYKTGDLVFEKDSLLRFVGRSDFQIKHMGYRIELEEIDAALNGLDAVQQAVTIYYRANDRFGRLVAFIQTSENLNETKLRKDLSAQLPKYMMPQEFKQMRALLKNANGKVDRAGLLKRYTNS